MADLNFLVSAGVTLIVIYLAYKYFYGGPEVENGSTSVFGKSSAGDDDTDSRNFVALMEKNNKNVIVFFGSQTGTAEDLASKLSKELSSKYGLHSMPADLENFDFECFDQFPEDHLAIFLMASYGDGEPTDNAQDFYSFISSSPTFSNGGTELSNVQFAVFGLGNELYEFYNKCGKDTFKYLSDLGAKPVGPYGEGDDSKGLLEEDFMAWKDEFLSALVSKWGLTEREAVYEPSVKVEETGEDAQSPDVYLGEPNLKHLQASKSRNVPEGPYTSSNPLLAKVTAARELFENSDRHCIHMEFDTTGLSYSTGDHLAFWCHNSEEEVNLFLKAFGITKPHSVISLKVLDKTSKLRVPSPTTYETVIRYFLEINGPVSRQVLTSIAPFAPSADVKAKALKLAGSKELFAEQVAARKYNLARLLLHLNAGQPWTNVPFSWVLDTVPHLQPRYYSISSSALETPNNITITAVVERQKVEGVDHELHGVATNEIYSLERSFNGQPDNAFALRRPHDFEASSHDLRVPVHVRHSLFKLPAKPSTPIIMIGPGTGVAPFRGFVRERAVQEAAGKEVGKALLFFGCRHENEDFLYKEEWGKYSSFLQISTAFSRDGPNKMYVQKRLKERASEVNKLINEGAVIYVCGDASRMARDVHAALLEVIAQERNISAEEADKIIRKLRSRNKYQEDVW